MQVHGKNRRSLGRDSIDRISRDYGCEYNKEKMRIYLDNCTFNRPFDDQSWTRVRLESEAKLHIQEKIEKKEIELVWSYILDIENDQNPFEEKRRAIEKWKNFAIVDIEETPRLVEKANNFVTYGIKAKDALYISSCNRRKGGLFCDNR